MKHCTHSMLNSAVINRDVQCFVYFDVLYYERRTYSMKKLRDDVVITI